MDEALGRNSGSGEDRAVYVFGKPIFVPKEVLGTELLSVETAAEDLAIELDPPQLSLLKEVTPSVNRRDQEAIQRYIAEKAWAGQQG
ncbi:hypothetical protein COY17_03655 [Candidatus Saccharibacteria bacterium CG_4_10_14_0_2_um_filter_52_9]|nr:MAG: hypothetical protein COY17_03655 [Candidatus Saccharibacteria bacterium CG_4_10_14_0_2_um_filter_52_9]